MEIIELNKEKYKGFEINFKYKTSKYYDVIINDKEVFDVKLELKDLDNEITKEFDGILYEDYFENAEAFGIVLNNKIIAFLEVDYEKWCNRLRITNILVLHDYRGSSYATVLIEKTKQIAEQKNIREIILETQTCNYPAIKFYLKNGFKINGIDLSSYSNNDILEKEVRLELIYRL